MAQSMLVTLASPFIFAGVALSIFAAVLAMRLLVSPRPTPPEPDPCTEAARELEQHPDTDDAEELATPPPSTITNRPHVAPTPAATTRDDNWLIELGDAIFTRAEIEQLDAVRGRWMAGAA